MNTAEKSLIFGSVGILALLALVLVMFKPQPTEPIENAKHVVDLIRVTHPGLTKLKAAADAHARTAHLTADSAARLDSAAHASRDTTKTGLRVQLHLAFAASDAWHRAYAHMDVAHTADTARGNGLDTLVNRATPAIGGLLKIADCHLLGVGFLPRCLPRKTSFALGAVAMLGVGLALHVHL